MDSNRTEGPRRRILRGAVAALLGAAATTASGGEAALSAEMLQPGLYRIVGPGGSALVRLGAQGSIVVDSNRAGGYRALMAQIQPLEKVAAQPARALVLTAAGPEQAGNVAQFRDAGYTVVVQKQALPLLAASANAPGAAAPPKGYIVYEADHDVRAGDVRAEVEHVGRGRTGADSVVFFRDLRVVGVGDLYTHGTPQPDCASGGSYAGWASAITHVSWLDFDVAVPSRGAPVGKPELLEFKKKLEALARSASTDRADCRPAQ